MVQVLLFKYLRLKDIMCSLGYKLSQKESLSLSLSLLSLSLSLSLSLPHSFSLSFSLSLSLSLSLSFSLPHSQDMARLSTASLMLHLAVQVLQVDKELQVNNVVMMASWLLHLLVQKTVLYVLVSFDIFNLAK